jgi:hypothetical protein
VFSAARPTDAPCHTFPSLSFLLLPISQSARNILSDPEGRTSYLIQEQVELGYSDGRGTGHGSEGEKKKKKKQEEGGRSRMDYARVTFTGVSRSSFNIFLLLEWKIDSPTYFYRDILAHAHRQRDKPLYRPGNPAEVLHVLPPRCETLVTAYAGGTYEFMGAVGGGGCLLRGRVRRVSSNSSFCARGV